MNRIILIGNGFDLAHGMPTSYTDFLNDYWKQIFYNIKSSFNDTKLCSKIFIHFYPVEENEELIIMSSGNKKSLNEKKSNYPFPNFELNVTTNFYQEVKKIIRYWELDLSFKNKFFEIITKKSYLKNWIDIENEYYMALKDISINKDKPSQNLPSGYNVSTLNKEFARVKQLLYEYFGRIELNSTKSKYTISKHIHSSFNIKDDFNKGIANTKFKSQTKNVEKSKEYPNEILFLNFNYTRTEWHYTGELNNTKEENIDTIHIHGLLGSKENPIIFGFGDELDDNYAAIQKLNDNEYLENIKSINYLETNNYKKLLEFIESDNYQIFIFGHSCGLSDRTLLNTLFEHTNCASIKPFYHQKKEKDNYRDIIKNISRNFNDQRKMRQVVVDKTQCEPLVPY